MIKQILHRRYSRLSLALLLALIVHCTLMLTGVLTISMFSAPSDTNRALTITLQTTPIEGLKESIDVEQETVNEVQKATANAPKASNEIKKINSQTQEIALQSELYDVESPSQNSDESSPTTSETNFASKLNNIEQASQQLTKIKETVSQGETSESKATDTINKPTNTNESLEFILANKGLIQIPSKPASITPKNSLSAVLESLVGNSSKSYSYVTASNDVEVTSKEQKSMERKIQRRLRKLIAADFFEPNISWKHKGQTYIANVTPLEADSDMHMDQILVDVVTERDGKKLTTTLRLKQLAFSNFAQFVDQWDNRVIMHDDEMNGRFHSNSAFNLTADSKGAPVFHKKATTAALHNNFEGLFKRSKVFLAGLETGVKKIRMPKPNLLFEDNASTQNNETHGIAQTIIVSEDSRLIFQADGSVYWQALNSAQPMRKYELTDQHNYFIAAPGVSLNVRGTINGLAAIYSPKRITIEGSIEYSSRDPIRDGGDFLGLVSGRNVYIAKPKIVGEGDLNIDAAIYAKDRFAVKGLRSNSSATLHLFGSVTSGSVSATEPRYATRIDFDPRLENMRPPGFPVTDRFELIAEKQKWRVTEKVFSEHEELNQLIEMTSEAKLKKAPLKNNSINNL